MQSKKDSLYNTDPEFKSIVHRVLEFTCNRHSALTDKVYFACKSRDEKLIPALGNDQMNSAGSARIQDVIDYLCNEDGLYKHIRGAPAPKKRRPDDPPPTEFIELRLRTQLTDREGVQYEVALNPELPLEYVRKYLYSFVDTANQTKHMPLYFTLKNPTLSEPPAQER